MESVEEAKGRLRGKAMRLILRMGDYRGVCALAD